MQSIHELNYFKYFHIFFMCFAFEKWTILWHPDKYCCFLLHAYHMFWGQESRLNGEKGYCSTYYYLVHFTYQQRLEDASKDFWESHGALKMYKRIMDFPWMKSSWQHLRLHTSYTCSICHLESLQCTVGVRLPVNFFLSLSFSY